MEGCPRVGPSRSAYHAVCVMCNIIYVAISAPMGIYPIGVTSGQFDEPYGFSLARFVGIPRIWYLPALAQMFDTPTHNLTC